MNTFSGIVFSMTPEEPQLDKIMGENAISLESLFLEKGKSEVCPDQGFIPKGFSAFWVLGLGTHIILLLVGYWVQGFIPPKYPIPPNICFLDCFGYCPIPTSELLELEWVSQYPIPFFV